MTSFNKTKHMEWKPNPKQVCKSDVLLLIDKVRTMVNGLFASNKFQNNLWLPYSETLTLCDLYDLQCAFYYTFCRKKNLTIKILPRNNT